ncbi:MAG: transglycosylase SLT domain-containing protein, partial [Spirochaetales bacterium]|nr:transglycosylase SLT domain-containing protein [Spirochaetales bacterium]
SAFDRGIIYNDYVCRKIDEYSLPQALKFLPVIESGCNPDAVSPSGAAGLWQFMLNSIEPYDLQVNEWIDERRDFWKSTIAGLRKLQYNQSVLGDWLLAIAAYNCGLNRMKLALEESTSRDFWELVENGYLPEETATYVPKFLAVVHIARNAHAYGLQLPAATGWEWVRIRLNGQLNLRLFTRNAEIPLDILALGNAELRHDVTPPAEHAYHLKVPDIYSDVIHRLLENAQMLNRYYVHDIQPGDTLYALARVYGVSMDTIKEHNPGIEPRFLQVNAKLIIPAVKEIP